MIMDGWNYRVIEKTHKGESYYAIHEVYYEDGEPHAVTERSIPPFGDTLEELEKDIVHMKEAFDKPVLRYDDIVDD